MNNKQSDYIKAFDEYNLDTPKGISHFCNRVVSDELFISIPDFDYINNKPGKVQSLNKKYVNNKGKIAIVGTITPFRGNGYYCTSTNNRVYETLDRYFGIKNPSLVDLKKELKNKPNDKTIINQIITILKQHGIVFIDVIAYAYYIKASSLDDDIMFLSLDYESFKNIEVDYYICTSKNARDCLYKINNNINKDTCEICHQDRYHYKYEKWEKILNKFLKNQ